MENPWPMRHEKISQDKPQFNNKNYVIVHVYHSIPLKTRPSNSLDTTPAQYIQCHACCAVYSTCAGTAYTVNFLRVKRWIRLLGLAAS